MSFVRVFEFMSKAGATPPVQYVGTKEGPRSCRFCAPRAPGKFKEKKHVVPEALGNKSLFSWNECDDCNQRASQFENDLAVHLSLVRLFSRLPGKASKGRKVDEFKHRFGRDKSNVARSSFTTPIAVELHQGEDSVRIRRISDGFVLAVRVPTYRLLNVAKALVRMALFVCDGNDAVALAHCFRWLRDEDAWPVPLFWQTFVPQLSGEHVGMLLQRNVGAPDEAPYILNFTYGGMFMGIAIPNASWAPPKVIDMPNLGALTPSPVFTDFVQFEGEGLREKHGISTSVHVPALVGVAPPTHDEIANAAFERYNKRGQVDGFDLEDWIEAEQDLLWEQVGRLYRADSSEPASDTEVT